MSSDLLDQLQSTLGTAYHVERELGGGGMARVFVAEDETLHRRVVVKVLSPDLAAGVSLERFKREIQVAAQLHHPHIVPVLSAGQSSDLLYYTMPYIEGESLRALIARQRQLTLDRALRIVRDVAEALDYAHGHNIVHRDIKPDNILIERDTGHAVVTDFGIARAIEKAVDIVSVTSTGLTLGTPTYMSPEQASAEAHIDGRSDIYSLGCVLYEMLGGAPPFTGPTAQAIIAQHLGERPRSLRVVRPDLPAHVDSAIQHALAKVPAARFQTAGELAAGVSGTLPVTSMEQETRESLVRRSLRAWLAVGIVAIAAGLGVWKYAKGASRPDDARDPRKVAVLYFDAPASDSMLAVAARGMTRDLITVLGRIPVLDVLSEAGLHRYANTDPATLAEQLQIGTIVTGSIERRGDSLRVSAQLVDAPSMRQRATVTQTVPSEWLVQMRDTVVQEIALHLRRRIGSEVELHEWRSATSSARAWQLVQRANDALNVVLARTERMADTTATRAALRSADSLLLLARAADPGWAEVPLTRGWLLGEMAGLTGTPDSTFLDSAIGLASGVLRRNGDDARALELRGVMRLLRLSGVEGTPVAMRDSAEADLRRAVMLDESRGRAWNTLSLALELGKDTSGAIDAARKAIEADVFAKDVDRSMNRLIFAYLYRSHFDSARAVCATARRTRPENAALGACELSVLGWSGSGPADVRGVTQALAETERRAPFALVNGIWPPGRYMVAAVLVRSGMSDSARAVMAATSQTIRDAPDAEQFLVYEAWVRLMLGERDQSLSLLERYVSGDRPRRSLFVKRLPWFIPLHDEERYHHLIAR